jgi:drug/metabolite transporter (DMT)-like permease
MKLTFSPFLTLLVGAACIGFSPIFARMSEVGPIATAFWRMALAAPFLFASGKIPSTRDITCLPWKFIGLSGLFFACDLIFWHLSLTYTTVANATLLTNSVPIFVTLGAWLLWRETVSKSFIISVGVTLFGAGMLTGNNLTTAPSHLLGDSLAVLSAVFYSAYFLAIRIVRERVDSSRMVMLAISLVSSGMILVVALLTDERIIPQTLYGWLVIIALALVVQAIGQTLITSAMAQLKTSLSSVGLMLQPVVAALVAWWLFSEAIGLAQVMGGLIVLLGVYMASRTR